TVYVVYTAPLFVAFLETATNLSPDPDERLLGGVDARSSFIANILLLSPTWSFNTTYSKLSLSFREPLCGKTKRFGLSVLAFTIIRLYAGLNFLMVSKGKSTARATSCKLIGFSTMIGLASQAKSVAAANIP